MKTDFALCPVHRSGEQATSLYVVPPGILAVAGRVVAVEVVIATLGEQLLDCPHYLVRPELDYGHPAQLVIAPTIWPPDAETAEFTHLGDGAYAFPEGVEFERNEAGDLCAYWPSTGRHSILGPHPVGGLN